MLTRLWRWWNGSTLRPASGPRLHLEALDPRDVPAAQTFGAVTVAAPPGATDSTCQLVNAIDGSPRLPTITPFVGYRGVLSVSQGDVNRDGAADVIVAAYGNGGAVKAFNGVTGALLLSFQAFPGFNGVVNVGAADVNGDRFDDVLVAASDIGAHVKAFSGANGALVSSFLAFPGALGTVTVSGGDFNLNGVDEIIVGAGGAGAGGRVAIFNPNGTLFSSGFAAFPGFNGAVNVAGGDVTGDGFSDIVVGAGPGAPGGHVKTFNGLNFVLVNSFLTFQSGATDGVLVNTGDATRDGRNDILVTMQGGRVPGVAVYDGISGQLLNPSSPRLLRA